MPFAWQLGLEATLEAVPSHTELDVAMENINETLNILNMGEFPPSDKSYGELQSELNAAAVGLSSAASDVAQSVDSPPALAASGAAFGGAFNRLLGVSMEMAGHTEDRDTQTLMVSSMKSVTVNSSKLLGTAKSVSQENRARCAASTGPLQDAVRSLCQFADSPEFASIPAKISPQARNNQEAILECGRNIISGSCSMLESARLLGVSPGERSHWQQLAQHSKTVSDSIKGLVANIKEKAPGQRECLAALETLNRQLRELDQAAMQAVGQELLPRKNNTLQGYTEQMENSATEMLERLEPLRVAANGEAENLGHAVVQLVSYAEPLVTGAVGASSNLSQSETQAALLEHARTVLETLALLMHDARAAAGNPRVLPHHHVPHHQPIAYRSETQAALLEHARTVLETLALLMHDARAAAGNPRVLPHHHVAHHQPIGRRRRPRCWSTRDRARDARAAHARRARRRGEPTGTASSSCTSSSAYRSETQAALLEHARTVLETLALLMHDARAAAGNPRVLPHHHVAHHQPIDSYQSRLPKQIEHARAHLVYYNAQLT
ncbi:hypothetical protein HF086_013647 [Spodoptera exigua]|uniref:Uncharacterized protein n=1 Tax=Spodoptera exigua TaxID=7107 RepID=A0A922M9J5_SPOEX|nr:hypothetical protein HF086_013647 [Spodoptera exigua]